MLTSPCNDSIRFPWYSAGVLGSTRSEFVDRRRGVETFRHFSSILVLTASSTSTINSLSLLFTNSSIFDVGGGGSSFSEVGSAVIIGTTGGGGRGTFVSVVGFPVDFVASRSSSTILKDSTSPWPAFLMYPSLTIVSMKGIRSSFSRSL